MRYKKIMVLAIFLVSLLAVSAVSAADNATSDVFGVDETTTDIVEITADDAVSVENDNQVSANDSDVGTFDDLANDINAVEEGGVLNLTKDYNYVNGSTEGIQINKAITIDGQGHVIDGKKLSKIFILNGDVIINNVIFTNGKSKDYTSPAISVSSGNIIISNCSFNNNINLRGSGGAIGANSPITIYGCNFVNNSAPYSVGGAIYLGASNSQISNCNFIDNYCSYNGRGHAIFIGTGPRNISISNSNFSSSQNFDDGQHGCIILVSYVSGCKFTNCTFLTNDIFAVNYESSMDCIIDNCKFEPENNNILADYKIISENTDAITFIKESSRLIFNNLSFDYNNCEEIKSFLFGENNNILINKKVKFIFNSDTINNTFINYGDLSELCDKFNLLGVGIWNVTVTFEGNDNYAPCNATTTITVLPTTSSVTVADVNATLGHEISLVANVNSSSVVNEGVVTFFDGENTIGESSVTNGTATLNYVPATDGEHTITAIFNSDNYLSSNSTANLVIDSATVEILVDNSTVGYNSTFVANVKGLYSTINKGSVAFYIGDEYLGNVPVVDGVASLVYTPLIAGDYTVKAIFMGSDNFLDDENTTIFTVKKADSEIIINNMNGTVGHELTITVNVVSSNNLTINEGYVLFFDGSTQIGEANVVDGVATLTYTPATAGEHTIIAIFNSTNYLSSNSAAELLVDSATVDVLVDNGTVGYNSTFVANVKGLYSTINEGSVAFYIGDEYLGNVPVVDGVASLVYTPLIAGDYTVKAIFMGGDNFLDDENTTIFTVKKADSEIIINNMNGTVGHELTITVNVVSSNNLTINEGYVLFFDGSTQIGEVNVVEGVATLAYTPTTAGEHPITAMYYSTNYGDPINSALLTVDKADIDLSIDYINEVYFTNPSNFAININSNSKPVYEGKIKYYVNGQLVGTVDVYEGTANFDYVTDTTGSFTLTAAYEETDNYFAKNASTTFVVNKMPTTLAGESVIFDEESYKTFTAELKDNNNNGVGGQPVKIEVIKYSGESATFNGISDANGITIYDVGRLAGGMWYVTGIYDGNENYISSSFADKFLVVRVATTTEIEEIKNPKVNHSYKLKANIHDENGKLVKEGIVQFFLDGVDIGSIDLSNNNGHQNPLRKGLLGAANPMFEYKLNDDGEISDLYIEYIPTHAGKHTLTAVYEGTTIYKASNSTTTFEVTEENTTDVNETVVPEIDIPPLDEPSEDGSVTIILPSDATGKITLTINGKECYFAVVKGAANIIIPDLGDGNYPYTITYSGDSKYSSFTTNGTLNKVAPAIDPVITASNVKVTYATGKYYAIKVYGTDGKLANGAKVVIKVKGKTFKTLTTTNGVAKFKVTNVPGTYKMTISALGKSVTKTLTVKHLVTLKSVTVKKSAKKLTLQANLGKVNGKYLKNKKITFKFNGKKYTAKTNKKGVAKVTIKSSVLKKLKVGKKITYQATYSKDTVKKTVKIKK